MRKAEPAGYTAVTAAATAVVAATLLKPQSPLSVTHLYTLLDASPALKTAATLFITAELAAVAILSAATAILAYKEGKRR